MFGRDPNVRFLRFASCGDTRFRSFAETPCAAAAAVFFDRRHHHHTSRLPTSSGVSSSAARPRLQDVLDPLPVDAVDGHEPRGTRHGAPRNLEPEVLRRQRLCPCHHQNATGLAAGEARVKGLRFDAKASAARIDMLKEGPPPPLLLERMDIGVPELFASALVAFAAENVPPNPVTDMIAANMPRARRSTAPGTDRTAPATARRRKKARSPGWPCASAR